MEVYKTSAALGYNQFAFLLRLDKSKNGYDYLCIDTKNIEADSTLYQIGEVVEDLNDYYVDEAEGYELTNSPLSGTYLFEYWLSNL